MHAPRRREQPQVGEGGGHAGRGATAGPLQGHGQPAGAVEVRAAHDGAEHLARLGGEGLGDPVADQHLEPAGARGGGHPGLDGGHADRADEPPQHHALGHRHQHGAALDQRGREGSGQLRLVGVRRRRPAREAGGAGDEP